jgi:hypothetical protein
MEGYAEPMSRRTDTAKMRFSCDSPLEGAVRSELVSELGLFQRDSGR